MAKKKKQPKQSIKKRQTQKANKRKQIKKKIAAKKSPQKQMSMSKVKKNLKLLPGLVFEEEMTAIAFSPDEMGKVEDLIEPKRVDALAGAAWMESFKAALEVMDARFAKEQDANKNMMTQAMLYFMSQEPGPACMNQLAVAQYYNSKALAESGESLDFAALAALLKAYDEEHEEYLAERAEEQEAQAQEAPQAEPENLDDLPPGARAAIEAQRAQAEAEEEPLESGPFAGLLEEIESWAGGLELSDEKQERVVDDLTALFEDYAEEKDWDELAQVSASKVNQFQGWFERNMNPTAEDMELLGQSLTLFFASDLAKERFGAEVCQAVADKLATA